MNDYFESLNKIEYENVSVRNIFKRFKINDISDYAVEYITINTGTSLEQVSYQSYGTTKFWWTIALLNDIHDVLFDIPMNNDELEPLIQREFELKKSEYEEQHPTVTITESIENEIYEEAKETVTIENLEKQKIKIFTTTALQRFLIDIK